MYAGSSEELVECPVCGAKLLERRPPLRYGPNDFNCEKCGTSLRFSNQSQKRLIYVLLFVFAYGLAAIVINNIFGEMVGVVAAIIGAILALGALVWQGKVPQIEVNK